MSGEYDTTMHTILCNAGRHFFGAGNHFIGGMCKDACSIFNFLLSFLCLIFGPCFPRSNGTKRQSEMSSSTKKERRNRERNFVLPFSRLSLSTVYTEPPVHHTTNHHANTMQPSLVLLLPI